jgi:hypothetical protein
VPTRGYRFVAPVVETRPDAPRQEAWPRRWHLAAVAVVGITAAATAVLWTTGLVRRSDDGVATAAVFRQLTASPEVPVSSQAISPDGKYVAYSDRSDVHVLVIASGETRTLPNTAGMQVLGWNDDSTQIRTMDLDTPRTIWDVSLVGSARRRSGLVWPDDAVSMAPDGSSFLTRINGSMRPSGHPTRSAASFFVASDRRSSKHLPFSRAARRLCSKRQKDRGSAQSAPRRAMGDWSC